MEEHSANVRQETSEQKNPRPDHGDASSDEDNYGDTMRHKLMARLQQQQEQLQQQQEQLQQQEEKRREQEQMQEQQ